MTEVVRARPGFPGKDLGQPVAGVRRKAKRQKDK